MSNEKLGICEASGTCKNTCWHKWPHFKVEACKDSCKWTKGCIDCNLLSLMNDIAAGTEDEIIQEPGEGVLVQCIYRDCPGAPDCEHHQPHVYNNTCEFECEECNNIPCQEVDPEEE